MPGVSAGDDEETPMKLPPSQPNDILYHGSEPKYVTKIDENALRLLGNGSQSVVAACSVGDCVGYGTIIARSYGETVTEAKVLRAIRLAWERDLKTDLSYSIRLLVDTAVRALSPAVNDPTTAVQALDEIEGLLCRLVRKRLPDGSSWEGYLHLSFDEIRLSGDTQPLVMRRMRAAVISIASSATTETRRAQTLAYIGSIDRSIDASGLDPEDMQMMHHADRQGLGVSAEAWT